MHCIRIHNMAKALESYTNNKHRNVDGRVIPNGVRIPRITQKINYLDTAQSYGSSENNIGQSLGPDHKFKIISKFKKFNLFRKNFPDW